MFSRMAELLQLIWSAVTGLFRSRASQEAEIAALRHQLNVLHRQSPKRPAFSALGLFKTTTKMGSQFRSGRRRQSRVWRRPAFFTRARDASAATPPDEFQSSENPREPSRRRRSDYPCHRDHRRLGEGEQGRKIMAKIQLRSGREPKKPKKEKVKVTPLSTSLWSTLEKQPSHDANKKT
jgi:hypothetical protein